MLIMNILNGSQVSTSLMILFLMLPLVDRVFSHVLYPKYATGIILMRGKETEIEHFFSLVLRKKKAKMQSLGQFSPFYFNRI